MKITIDTETISKSSLSTLEVLLLLFLRQGGDVEKELDSLVKKEAIVKDMFDNILVTQRYSDELDNILLTSDASIPKEDELFPLAEKLMAIMPQCKKEGTPYYFKCNKREIVLKLKKFFKIYGSYSDEDIEDATKRYVESFHGDYHLMKLLKYFIMKDEKKMTSEGMGYIEESSMLATLLENKEDDSQNSVSDFGEIV